MKTNCFTCGRELERPPSRLKANPTQFCDFVCLGSYRRRQVDVTCAVCGKVWPVKASRATQNDAITCGPACAAKLRSANRVAYFGTGETRQATCARCGKDFTRKPSQLAKYGESFCGRECANAAKIGREGIKTGEWLRCETCGEDVWRTPAIREPHVFCSRRCARHGLPEPHLGKIGMRGSASPRWQGGKSIEPYTEGWGTWRSLEIRNRDGNRCRVCGATNTLNVHHRDMAKIDHSDANLITLCGSCHAAVHNGRLTLPP